MILFILPQDDETALHIAAYHGHVEVVKVLTEKKDKLVINARDGVSIYGNIEIVIQGNIRMFMRI